MITLHFKQDADLQMKTQYLLPPFPEPPERVKVHATSAHYEALKEGKVE